NLRNEGWDLPLFEPVSWLEIDLPRGERIRFDFEDDLFEMEDQRNWTDASFKTSSTPASLGYHHEIERGGRIRQRLAFRLDGAGGPPADRRPPATTVRVGAGTGVAVPAVGIRAASHGRPLGQAAAG